MSAGNRRPRSGNRAEQGVTEYPRYLIETANRLCEPAGAMNVLTVGSLAHGEGLGPELQDEVNVRPITRRLEPSPFTRTGPGIGNSCKPDLVDIGGTMIFDAVVARLRDGAGISPPLASSRFTIDSLTDCSPPLPVRPIQRLWLPTRPRGFLHVSRARRPILCVLYSWEPRAYRTRLDHMFAWR